MLLTLAATPVAWADTLQCPAGSKREAIESPELKKRVELCVDEKTGINEGPGRAFNERGELLVEFTNKAGEQVSQKFTQAGARNTLADVNGALEMMRMPAKMIELDARTLRFEIRIDPPEGEVPDKQAITDDLRSDPYTCLLMQLPGGPYQVVKVRYQRTSGEIWLETQIRREECPPRN